MSSRLGIVFESILSNTYEQMQQVQMLKVKLYVISKQRMEDVGEFNPLHLVTLTS